MVTGLDGLRGLQLEVLNLWGNPLCERLAPSELPQRVTELLPGLQRLDGTAIGEALPSETDRTGE